MKFLVSVVLFASVILSFEVSAKVYKWVDEEGNTHYSQTPPVSEVEVETIETGQQRDSSAAQEQVSKQIEKADALREQRLKREKEKEKLEDEKKAKDEYCQKVNTAKESYTINTRVLVEEKDGSQKRLTEEQRQEKIIELNKQIEENCN